MRLSDLLQKLLSERKMRQIRRFKRRIYEFIGSDKYSCPAQHEMDKKLESFLPKRGGFFIEVGANDGYRQSNTYYFEKMKNWEGILIEAIPELYERCKINRPNSEVYNFALVSDSYESENVEMAYADLMSIVTGARKSHDKDQEHVKKGEDVQGIESYKLTVPARTLTSIVKEANPKAIDLLSLDVEGNELEALKGLDFEIFRPKFILVEMNFPKEISEYLELKNYKEVTKLSPDDVLFKDKN